MRKRSKRLFSYFLLIGEWEWTILLILFIPLSCELWKYFVGLISCWSLPYVDYSLMLWVIWIISSVNMCCELFPSCMPRLGWFVKLEIRCIWSQGYWYLGNLELFHFALTLNMKSKLFIKTSLNYFMNLMSCLCLWLELLELLSRDRIN